MSAILAVTFPFFALIFCGWLAARSRVLPDDAVPGLNAFVLFFALPCMLFRFGAGTPIAQMLNPALVAVYAAAALLVVPGTLLLTRRGRAPQGRRDAAFGALVAAFPNSGFIGVPLLVALMGPAAAGPAICTLLVDLILTSSLCLAWAQSAPPVRHAGSAVAAAPSHAGLRAALQRAFKGVVSNPQPWAISVGALFSVLQWSLPGPLHRLVGLLADAASPVALFTIGAVLWRSGPQAAGRTPLAGYLPVALVKLFVHPALVFVLGRAAQLAGWPLTAFQLTALTLVAALPSASNVSLLAQRYGADNGRVARIILCSTVLAFASFSLLAWAFGLQPN